MNACGGADQAYRLLVLEHLDHLADTAADAISNIKFDKVVMWGGANGEGPGVSSFVTDLMSAVPPALQTMMDIGGVRVSDGIFEVIEDGGATATAKSAGAGATDAASTKKAASGGGGNGPTDGKAKAKARGASPSAD